MTSQKNTLSLLELNALVRQVLEETLDEYWVEAELSECRESRGHCYMELIQKDIHSNTPVARASAKCWRTQWMTLAPKFARATGQQMHTGLKVRLKVYAQFHEAYGFSWIVTDIDPTFTMGDQARQRQAIIRQLREEGIFDMQKDLALPTFCLHIAVISSQTAAGYGDFVNQLCDSPFRFETRLYPATMQGEQVEQSVIGALEAIYADHARTPYDAVVIIRGGGATADLSGFDTLALAENVAQFPLPVITGIGHDRDESILDMVSHTRVKTPTAAAAFLIANAQEVLDTLNFAQTRIAQQARQRMNTLQAQLAMTATAIPRLFSVVKTRQEARIDSLHSRLSTLAQQKIAEQRNSIDAVAQRIPLMAERRMTAEKHRLEMLEEKAKSLDPALLLKRGYSITLKDGKAVRDPALLKPGDQIETRIEKGTIKSIIT